MDSCVYRKTRCVLWVPLVAAAAAEPCQQHIGQPFLWRPTRTEDLALSADWEELMETVCLGQLDTLTAHRGHCLQIRPKAANAQARRWGIDATGRPAPTLPRGFYLRSEFTEALVRRHLVVP
jgi:DNA mismatch repair protein MutH